jgi:hypothetical protein
MQSCTAAIELTVTYSALSLAFWSLALHAPLPPNWHSQVRTRAKLSWLSLGLEWLDSSPLQWLLDAFSDPCITHPQVTQSG